MSICRTPSFWALLAALACGSPVSAQRFETDIQPLFARSCTACHGATAQAGLDLRTLNSALKGSTRGPVIVVGAPEKSALFLKISTRQMPPKGAGEPLTDEQIHVVQQWIEKGIAPQSEAPPPAAPTKAARPITDADRDFWSFRKVARPQVPKLAGAGRIRTPIDAFLLEKLRAARLDFSPEASKRTLLRRATYDLTGLPPTTAETQAFLNDTRPDAYERLLDRLLASPQYGERWGRHWLDVAGYTDEQGFASDLPIVIYNEGIWRYRDYVVRSFNNDKGYDRFLTEQLAGDEMIDLKKTDKFTPEALDLLIATGYNRLMMDLTDASEVQTMPYYFDVLSRTVDNLTSGVMGLTGGCARCHDHKYDPIRQKDYYSLTAVFAAAFNPDKWVPPAKRTVADVSKAEIEEIDHFNAEIDRPLSTLKNQLKDLRRPHEQRLFDAKLQAAVGEALRGEVRAAFEAAPEKRTDTQKYLVSKLEKVLSVSAAELEQSMSERERAATAKLEDKIRTMSAWRRSHDKVQALWDLGAQPAMHVLERGQPETKGIEVKPGFVEVLSVPGHSEAVRPPDTAGESTGARLALARWLTSADHPLTARVAVNRIWMHHFHRGIVSTPENFGRKGDPPSHPQLLDWLAADFMENGWKMKRLHQMILSSTAYRQSSQPTASLRATAEKADPDNRLLWRMNMAQLEAEVIRDSVLAVSGKLDLTLGGKPVPLEGSPDGLVTVSDKDQGRFRRSLYLMARRTYSLSMLDVFNFPIMTLNCTERRPSPTPLQSLTMLNSEFVMQRATDFASAVTAQAGAGAADEKKVSTAFQMALARTPTPEEAQWSLEHLKQQRELYQQVRASEEQAAQRGLASLCQALLSANEFLYID